MKYLPLNAEIFIKNRQRFVKQIKPRSIAIFTSNEEVVVNGDALYPYKQNSDLFWLTGIVQEETMVVFFPDNPDPGFGWKFICFRFPERPHCSFAFRSVANRDH